MQTPATKQVYCLVRRQWVAATPEEMVRQRLLIKLVEQLGFSLGHMAVEVSLRNMPHLINKSVMPPLRRADILCYAAGVHPAHSLYPLLLIECKAVPLNDKVIRQTVGYNGYVQAYYVAIANETEEKIGWRDASGSYHFTDGLPTCHWLVEHLTPPERPGPLPH